MVGYGLLDNLGFIKPPIQLRVPGECGLDFFEGYSVIQLEPSTRAFVAQLDPVLRAVRKDAVIYTVAATTLKYALTLANEAKQISHGTFSHSNAFRQQNPSLDATGGVHQP